MRVSNRIIPPSDHWSLNPPFYTSPRQEFIRWYLSISVQVWHAPDVCHKSSTRASTTVVTWKHRAILSLATGARFWSANNGLTDTSGHLHSQDKTSRLDIFEQLKCAARQGGGDAGASLQPVAAGALGESGALR